MSTAQPFLLFPKGASEKKASLPPAFPDKLTAPSAGAQKARLEKKFDDIVSAFDDLQKAIDGFEPERVIVFETRSDSVGELAKAAAGIKGLEWVAELDLGEQPADDDFSIAGTKDKPLPARLYALMSNLQAARQLVTLWGDWTRDSGKRAASGFGPFKTLFGCLKDVRRWGPEDRLYETGVVQVWEENAKFAEDHPNMTHPAVLFEVELWCRGSSALQNAAYGRLAALVAAAGGRCLSQFALADISYHGVLVEMPATTVRETIEKIRTQAYTELLRCEDVMFFRPRAQSTFPLGEPAIEAAPGRPTTPAESTAQPIIAVLDGLPLENHDLLRGRLRIDDPDNFAAHYKVEHQQHGTAMCSLILHGDLSHTNEPLKLQVYARPVLVPVADYNGNYRGEGTPHTSLLIDLFHRAIRRLFEPQGGEPPAAPHVKVVNLSFGNPWQPFDRQFSPLARLLDWLAWKYKVLFLISAGNQGRDITIATPSNQWKNLDAAELTRQAILAMRSDQAHRRPFSPAEAMNAVTVGGWHEDGCGTHANPHVDLFRDASLPSPFATVAAGYDQSVKPEVFFPAGRQLYRAPFVEDDSPTCFSLLETNRPPGLKVAAPGTRPMELDRAFFSRGTSDATALATRAVGLAYQQLQGFSTKPGWEDFKTAELSVVLKALLVHGAMWGNEAELIESAIPPGELQGEGGRRDWQKVSRLMNRFIGCGKVDPTRAQFATDERATVLGWGSLEEGKSHVYNLPLPPTLSSKKVWRRLAVTLAWLSPVNPRHRNYRQAFLWTDVGYDVPDPVDPTKEKKKPTEGKKEKVKKTEYQGPELLQVSRAGLDEKSSQRGTVQHRVWEGEKAAVYGAEEWIQIRVNCKEDAGRMKEPIPYCLAVSLEVKEGVDVPVYQEVKERILIPVKPKTPVAPKA